MTITASRCQFQKKTCSKRQHVRNSKKAPGEDGISVGELHALPEGGYEVAKELNDILSKASGKRAECGIG